MRSSGSSVILFAMLVNVVLVSAEHQRNPGEKFGKKLCAEAKSTASHSELLEREGNRTSCLVSFNDTASSPSSKVLYTTSVAMVKPLQEATFKVESLGTYELKFTGECPLDPCYKVESSPEEKVTGGYVYTSPGMVNDKLAYIVVLGCKDGEQVARRVGIYDASPEIVEHAKRHYGMELPLPKLKECVEKAAKAGQAA